MGRKLFGGIPLDIEDDPALDTGRSQGSDELGFAGRSRARSAQALAGGILELTANSIRDLDPDVILADGPADRLELDPVTVGELAESIKTYGQQVPILVRPSGIPERYKIVYGRRRLAAIRMLGPDFRVKAIVRTLEDDAAIIAQGQENNLRVDPSYIEKALFARALREMGYDTRVIQDALGVERTAVAKMKTVAENVPMEVILHIGAAHEVGRVLWTELAQLSRDGGVDLTLLLPSPAEADITTRGVDRFTRILTLARERDKNMSLAGHEGVAAVTAVTATHMPAAAAGPRPIQVSGQKVGTLKKSGQSILLNVSLRHQPDFGKWFEEHADAIVADAHDRWMKSRGEG